MPDEKIPIVITGGSGFVGANCVRRFARDARYSVHCFIREGKLNWRLLGLEDKIIIHEVDLTNSDLVKEAIEQIQPAYVFHCATYGGYSKQKDARLIVQTNVVGSTNLFEALKNVSGLKKIVNTGSSSEYGMKADPMHEGMSLEPNTIYGATKAAQTLLARAFALEGLPIVTLRLLSVFGPYEEQGRFMADVMLALARSATLQLSSPFPKRDFIFIDDVVDAYEIAAKSEKRLGEIYNIGGGCERSLGEVVESVLRFSEHNIPLEWGAVTGRSFDTTRWVSDISRASNELAWKPRHSFEEGLKKTYDWFCQNEYLYEK